MKQDFKVGDIVVRNSIGGHDIIKEGTRWRVVKTFDEPSVYSERFFVVARLDYDNENGLQYEEFLSLKSYFDLSPNNYYNTSKYGKNYRQKVAT